ncbi:amidohydrolase family protein [Olivibacter sp. SDN3]|uniref:amidohydrolase family protein n=1 Tax=Olivibacter sp. SDN3 TaxID=2764720 RepID=UPI001651572B|nr:amidohydrolase family protein [Olivibacter sp. SDN3]QNL50722.1 amidohydrolase family protein [Olivibacter sp. SDN3]
MKDHIIKYIFSAAVLFAVCTVAVAQPTIYPAKPQQSTISVRGATIHVGNGQIIQQGTLVFEDGKIIYVGEGADAPEAEHTIDAQGKHVYPGFIAPVTNLGLVEVESVRATVDYAEVGENNAHVRSLIAYNADSKVINTLRSNGILLAQVTPQSGLVSGQSSVVQLDAWNWEDAVYLKDDAVHVNWPTVRFSRFGSTNVEEQKDRIKRERVLLEDFLADAKSYASGDQKVFNARLDAFKKVFEGSKKVMVHADKKNDLIAAIQLFKRYAITPTLVGAQEGHLIAPFLKEHGVNVIIHQAHALPGKDDDDVNLPYKQAKLLTDAGVLVAYGMDGFWQQRNLPFMAGTAAAFGLDKEAALATITLNTAKILGVDDRTGSLEQGKDANFFIADGDALDMRGNQLEKAFILGKDVNLDNLHKQLFQRYEHKYSQND